MNLIFSATTPPFYLHLLISNFYPQKSVEQLAELLESASDPIYFLLNLISI